MSESIFFNREISWLEFNHRVLKEAEDESNPLLERLMFLAISASNLDEFFMVRVGGLMILKFEKKNWLDISSMTVDEQLDLIASTTRTMMESQYKCYLNSIEPNLTKAGIKRVKPNELTSEHNSYLERLFDDELFSVISPIAVMPEQDFPLITGRILHLVVRFKAGEGNDDRPKFAIIPFSKSMNRFITLPSGTGYEFILLEDVIMRFIDKIFPGEPIAECVPFRIIRNADIGLHEDEVDDMLREMEEIIRARKRSDAVKIEIAAPVTKQTVSWLQKNLKVSDSGVYAVPGSLELSSLRTIANVGGFNELKYEIWQPQPHPNIDPQESMFDSITRNPILLIHPYDSFDPIVRLIEESADDPDVLAIKQCLYRTSPNSPIVAALGRAARKGKYVTAIVELKARFDEERNIEWAKKLEDDGVNIIYGIRGLKTHSKILMVVRREPQGIVRYVHFGTGNYNEITSRIYSDVSYLTTDEDLGYDAAVFFNTITGNTQPRRFRKIEAAPIGLRETLLSLIDGETGRKLEGHKAAIMAKLNSLVDPQIIEALYRASKAGIKIQLNVRGICCLKPGVQGLSENISVVSIVDRFLEHARILYFYHGGEEKVFISSADWMPRNLDRRIELLVPVEDTQSKRRLISTLKTYFNDTAKSWTLTQLGNYEQLLSSGLRKKPFRSQEFLFKLRCAETQELRKKKLDAFEPLRPAEE